MTDRDWREDRRLHGLEVYLVGGAVRDRLLGLTPAEHDFVVVGTTPEHMIRQGFRAVGRDFPVFIHPDSGEEYALARTERKQGRGYRGFVFHAGPEVTLDDDLRRRDLTINAIAEARDGRLVDPAGGRGDLERHLLRHVSRAFAEDPVRLLRLGRFAARFPDFRVHPDTLALCRRMVDDGEVDQLVPERVWQELSRALMTERPARFFEIMREAGALARVLPEVDALFGVPQRPEYHPEVDTGVHTLMVLDQAARLGASLPARYASLVHDLGKALTPPDQLPAHRAHEQAGLAPVEAVNRRLRVPRACRDLALLVCEFHLHAHRALELKPRTVLRLFERLDIFRRPERLRDFLDACEADARGRTGLENRPYPQRDYLQRAARAAAAVEAATVLRPGLQGPAIAEALRRERTWAIAAEKDRVARLPPAGKLQ